MKPVGVEARAPTYLHVMPGKAWQLLWWLIYRMDEHSQVLGGWRRLAASELGCDRIHIYRCAKVLLDHGFIDTRPNERSVKVIVSAINAPEPERT